MDNTTSWSDPLQQRLKLERNLNFSNLPIEDEDLINFAKKKTSRDPTSHRIIEKRRRDRMNNCLADLSRLIPSSYMKKARGRIEKTEIIEMAIRHLKHLQGHACKQIDKCEVALRMDLSTSSDQFHLGYQECMSEAMHFLVEVEGFYAADTLCVRLLNHLQKHSDKISRGHEFGSSSSSSCHSRNSGSTSSQSGDGIKEALNVLDISQNSISDCGQTEVMSANGDDDNMELTCDTTSCIANEADPKGFEAAQSTRSHQSREVSYHQFNEASSITKSDEVYKFKTNIKDRFHADLKQSKHEVNEHENDEDSDTINGTVPSTTDDFHAESMPRLPPPFQISSSVTEQTKTSEDHHKCADQITTLKSDCSFPRHKSDNLPMFVLHPKNNYYIPMTIDATIVAPLITCVDDSTLALHPVSIAVYFGNAIPTIRHPTKPNTSSSVSPWYSSDLETSLLSDQRFLLTTSRA